MGKSTHILSRYLTSALRQPLPGKKAQYEMAAMPSKYLDSSVPKEAIKAAVLILLYLKDHSWTVAYIQRVSHEKDRHSGQISFPGGKMEKGDGSHIDTALRETEEEIGISRSSVKVLGNLSPFYIPISGFDVHPVVGMLDYHPRFELQSDEVDFVIEAPLKNLVDPKSKKKKDIRARKDIILPEVPYFDVNSHVVWGATAMITNELVGLLKPYPEAFS